MRTNGHAVPTAPAGTQAVAHPATARTGQLSGEQFLRLQAARLASEMHRNRRDSNDAQVLATAVRIAEYIRTGNTGA